MRTSFSHRSSSLRQGFIAAAVLIATIARPDGAPLVVSLTATDHHGYELSCFGGKDGAIDVTVSGGTPPYTYKWSNGEVTEDITSLAAGYYAVTVNDAGTEWTRAEITLTEPDALRPQFTLSDYPNGFNISCYQCFNGSITVQPHGGVLPYTYLWRDAVTTQNRQNMGAGATQVVITDVNGCGYTSAEFIIREPERSDWTMNGNTGSNPATQYIGTADNKDAVFKTNGAEALRLKSNGDIKLSGSLTNYGLLYRDLDGILRAGNLANFPLQPGQLCRDWHLLPPYWTTTGNDFNQICPGLDPRLGTLTGTPLFIITNDEVRMTISPTGKVGIGTDPPPGPVSGYRLYVENGIATRDVLVKTGPWPDYVFAKGYALMPLDELRAYLSSNGHLPGMPSAKEVETKTGVEIGDTQTRMLKVLEEQALYILQLEQRIKALEASK